MFWRPLGETSLMDVSDRNFSIDPDSGEIIAWRFPVPGRRRDGVWSFDKDEDVPSADELKDFFEPILDDELSDSLDIEAAAAFSSMPKRESTASQA